MEHWIDFLAAIRWQGRWLACGCLALAVIAGGCQGLSRSSLVPGFAESRQERQIARQAENDPFPSPSDVGIQSPE
jgi:hypothetical protein